MNCPSRTDDTLEHPSWNQNPPPFSSDTTTRNDFNGTVNSTVHRRHTPSTGTAIRVDATAQDDEIVPVASRNEQSSRPSGLSRRPFHTILTSFGISCAQEMIKLSRFLGPGFLIAVAYIDPGNYATDVAAGASYKYSLLFIVLLSNLFAILLQSLCIKLGTVTGLNLAENCRAYFPRWLVIILYIFTFALFVNSASLIVAGASISNIADSANADLFGIHSLLSQSIAPAAGLIFALALLLSGISAGIICTIAGQMYRPSIIIAGAVGRDGLNQTLNASQVILSIILPFVSVPLIYFTCFSRYMTVRIEQHDGYNGETSIEEVSMRNHFVVSVLAVLVWLLVLVGLGES